jgi:hypothetical protein
MAKTVGGPKYEVVRRLGDIDVRQYAPYVVAEMHAPGSADDAVHQAFPILTGYIFGKNKGARAFVTTGAARHLTAPIQFAMTPPVTQIAAAGGFTVQFVLPPGVTLASAPEPDDPRVTLRELPAHRLAAIRYSGFWSASNYATHLATLMAALKAVALSWSGEPAFSRYNAPWTPWFLRRNEIWLSLG